VLNLAAEHSNFLREHKDAMTFLEYTWLQLLPCVCNRS